MTSRRPAPWADKFRTLADDHLVTKEYLDFKLKELRFDIAGKFNTMTFRLGGFMTAIIAFFKVMTQVEKKLCCAVYVGIHPRLARPSTIDKATGRQYIMPTGFAWDNEKAASNIRDHEGVTFAQAAAAFSDKFAVEWIDEREEYGEERSVLLGMIGSQLLYVVYTEL